MHYAVFTHGLQTERASQSASLSFIEKMRSCMKIKSCTSGCRCCTGAAAIKYQLILTTSTGSLARFRTRHNNSVLYEGYEGPVSAVVSVH